MSLADRNQVSRRHERRTDKPKERGRHGVIQIDANEFDRQFGGEVKYWFLHVCFRLIPAIGWLATKAGCR